MGSENIRRIKGDLPLPGLYFSWDGAGQGATTRPCTRVGRTGPQVEVVNHG